MAVNKAYSQYKSNSITTASPEELTLMLYNGLMRFLMQADKSIENKETEKAHENIVRAQDIIMEFQATLDMQYDISHNLLQLYDYMNRRLIEANIKKDRKIIAEVLRFATELRDTWVQAMKIAKEQVAAEQKAAK
jgi:flagellar protein FliS